MAPVIHLCDEQLQTFEPGLNSVLSKHCVVLCQSCGDWCINVVLVLHCYTLSQYGVDSYHHQNVVRMLSNHCLIDCCHIISQSLSDVNSLDICFSFVWIFFILCGFLTQNKSPPFPPPPPSCAPAPSPIVGFPFRDSEGEQCRGLHEEKFPRDAWVHETLQRAHHTWRCCHSQVSRKHQNETTLHSRQEQIQKAGNHQQSYDQ